MISKIIETLIISSKDYRFDFGKDIKIEKYEREQELYFDPEQVKSNKYLPKFLIRKSVETDFDYFKRLTSKMKVS